MIKEIIKKEIIQNIYTLKFLILSLLLLMLFPFSMYLGHKNYMENLKEISRAKIAFKEDISSKKTWRQIADGEHRIVIPSHHLQIFVRGVTGSIGKTASFEFGKDIVIKDSDYDANPFLSIFGNLDLEFIFKIFLSLFAIVFSYDSISGEKESGMLKQILSNSISRSSLIIGKVIGGFLTMLIPISISITVGLLLIFYFQISLDIDDITRIFIIFLVGFLYLFVFFILGILISSFTHQANTSLLILLMIWIIIIFVIPNLSKELGSFLYSVESPSEITIQKDRKREAIVEKWKNYFWSQAKSDQAKILEDVYKKASEEIIDAFNKIDKDWNRKKIAQIDFITTLSRLSPSLCFSLSVMNLSDTGFERYINNVASLLRYRDDYYTFIRKKVAQEELAQVRKEMGLIEDYKIKVNFNEFPDYEKYFRKNDLLFAIKKSFFDILLLLIYLLLFFSIAYFKFLNYDVR